MVPILSKILEKNVAISLLEYLQENDLLYTVFTNGGHAGKKWCLVMKARRWRVNKNCK